MGYYLHPSSTRNWPIDGRIIAEQVKIAIDSGNDCLPAGVKFDPNDVELLEHLCAKCGVGNCKPHVYIDEFIPTLKEDTGICYTHPKDLPGAKKDGSCIYFFYKTTNAYENGPRKRRMIKNDQLEEKFRWYKTGKTKPIVDNNGIQKGYKKIMVLKTSSKKGSNPVKSNWVMHQFHLGTQENEKEGEFVVSKIFYQSLKEIGKVGDNVMVVGPSEPETLEPSAPKSVGDGLFDDALSQNFDFPPEDNFEWKKYLNI